ncbi:hypothetical protein Trydic_g7911 [Trypoxylus dichotomus]
MPEKSRTSIYTPKRTTPRTPKRRIEPTISKIIGNICRLQWVQKILQQHTSVANTYSQRFNQERTTGPIVEIISEHTVDTLPDVPRSSMELTYRQQYTKNKLTGKSIRIVSYNILAERYTDDEQFSYCDPKYLSIGYRKQVILEEVLNYKADLICMQEVDLEQYHDYFKNHFKNNGYIPVFYKKGHIIPEGLAFVYDRNRFKKLDCAHIVLSHELRSNQIFKDIWNFIKKYKDVKELFMKQHTSLLVTTLKLHQTDHILIVANTHLYYHREAGHVRLIQVAMALTYIRQLIKRIKKDGDKVSVIFCGDFNSRPQTAVYKFLTDGEVKNYEENLDCIDGARAGIFQHNFDFFSACGTPEFTNYTDEFKGCLDYIFCQKHMTVTQVLPFPPEEELAEDIALPNQYFPSDHLALVADIKL